MSTQDAPAAEAGIREWRVRRIDIRSPVLKGANPVARLELEHPERGRVTDIGEAPGAFDAAFVAAGHIVGVAPQLLSYNVRSGTAVPGEALPISIEVEIERNGQRFSGSSSGVDLVRCSVEAWLDAIAKSGESFGS